jgi:MFS transporter, SP family, arabinose:H+ symporter
MTAFDWKLNRQLLVISLIASLGGLLFGFDTAVIAGITGALTTAYHLSPFLLGVTVSSALWGTVAGAASAGYFSDRFGRRRCLRALALLYVLSALGCAFTWGWGPLLCFRILSGLAVGGSSVISPTYIAEIAPARLRGRLVGLFQFSVVFGILLAYLSNFCIGLLHLGPTDWRWKLGIAAVPAFLFLFSLFSIPESPRWLIAEGRQSEAQRVLEQTGAANPARELSEIAASLERDAQLHSERVFQWRFRKLIFLAVSIGLFNQLSGINAVLYYLNSIFELAGYDQISSNAQAIMIGLTNLAAVILAMFFIDRIGRRPLLLIGSVGTAICLGGVALGFQGHLHRSSLLWFLIGFIGFFSFSQGAVIWVYISEIFPTHVRAKGQSIGSFSHWFMNAIVSAAFPVVAASWGALPFYFFAAMMAVQFFTVLIFYPETRGVPLEALETRLLS